MRWWYSAGNLDEALAPLLAKLADLERRLKTMPTRDEMDAAKAEVVQAIADAGKRVASTIDALKNQLANGTAISQQDLDDLKADVQALAQIDAAP